MVSFTVSRWQMATIMYVAFVAVLLLAKPAIMFDADGRPKQWGPQMSEDTSPFAIAFVLPFMAIALYYLATMIDFWGGAGAALKAAQA